MQDVKRKCFQCGKFKAPGDLYWIEDYEGANWLMCSGCLKDWTEDPLRNQHYPDFPEEQTPWPYL